MAAMTVEWKAESWAVDSATRKADLTVEMMAEQTVGPLDSHSVAKKADSSASPLVAHWAANLVVHWEQL